MAQVPLPSALQLARLHLELQRVQGQQALALIQHYQQHHRGRRRRRRTVWVRPWITLRVEQGYYDNLMVELENEDPTAFKNLMRMEPAMFIELRDRLEPRLTKVDTNARPALLPGLKVAITLRHYASGDNYHSLQYQFRVPHNTISGVVREVTQAIIAEYAEEVVKTPQTAEEWREVAHLFSGRWNFHHALGAIDGKHIALKKPKNSGSLYFNYKGFFSIIMLALVDADYKFLWVEVGTPGSTSDAAVFNDTEFKEAIETGDINFPDAEPLPSDDEDMPYFIVGDDAFALKSWMMKPFSRRNMARDERIFNYRLSRARRIVENAFGILVNRFQVFLSTMRQEPQTVTEIVRACCCLHNLMRTRYPGLQIAAVDAEDDQHQLIPGAWRREHGNLPDVAQALRTNPAVQAKQQRLVLKHYYSSPAGAVPWQDAMI
jgi:hypothetical protein